mmetsp:Transcript_6430/g.9470  ORF Transcript_6430/g.9470 Transcript_6430/m.9470 type:complete len:217 (+) Transcript_6430:61-711(+)|eukprot:CAMPEP_0194208866 /NCGR_PEP_ID=MMETSP0156-20130528/7192_1 /TAXON_ID=33649 /ORGANISM="Thalassionema nitzschioides, Strain L26-B" /LENGTH=216 /DNA_ID=CAMNT_0038935917 /DNA_START=61 /DNA_END=711 /DNA_ORIENTATION=-
MPSMPSYPRRQGCVDESVTCPPNLDLQKSSVNSMKSRFRNELLKRNEAHFSTLNAIKENEEDIPQPVALTSPPDGTEQRRQNKPKRNKYTSRYFQKRERGQRRFRKPSSLDLVQGADEISNLDASFSPSIVSELTTGTVTSTWDKIINTDQIQMLHRFILLAALVFIADWAFGYPLSGATSPEVYELLNHSEIPTQLRRRITDASDNAGYQAQYFP